MKENSAEFRRYNNMSRDTIENNLSKIITDNICYNCYQEIEEYDHKHRLMYCATCKNEFKDCESKNHYNTPRFHIPLDYQYEYKDKIKEYGINSSTLDEDNIVHTVEDFIIRSNCNSIIVKQKVYRPNTNKFGYVIRMILSPIAWGELTNHTIRSINGNIIEEEIEYINIEDEEDANLYLYDLYDKDKIWDVFV